MPNRDLKTKSRSLHLSTQKITGMVLSAKEKAYKETSSEPEPEFTKKLDWPIQCTVGPGLEGAIACESETGYVNGAKGLLIYRGYDIFDLCAYSSFEEVAYLLLHGRLPRQEEFNKFTKKISEYQSLIEVKRLLMSFPVEELNPMAALRLGVNLMRQKQIYREKDDAEFISDVIATDEDSIPMETKPMGEKRPIYEFVDKQFARSEGIDSCYHLIAELATITASISRLRSGHLPLEPDPSLSHAANLLYMITGKRPTPVEERIMDICLILHADHGMNASTFATLVVASTLSDIYFSVGAGIAALNGPLHGGANEQVIRMLKEIADTENLKLWYENALKNKKRIMGFGHRVYKAYDPRARILGSLAKLIAHKNPEIENLFRISQLLEKEVISTLGKVKKVFPNVDFFSGIIYSALGIEPEMFPLIFAVSRVAGWTARVLEYLKHNRIFRPRSIYIGPFNQQYVPMEKR
ncbi:citrate/2-methylcitrate synthase [bacterium]|nr:citrate/2-methylcitrate synthase [bacterium]